MLITTDTLTNNVGGGEGRGRTPHPLTWICLAIDRRRRCTCWSSIRASSKHTAAMMDRMLGIFEFPSPRI